MAGNRVQRTLVLASMPLIGLVYRAWGRWWLTDDQCRTLVTAIMRTTLWLARVRTDNERG